MQSLAEWKFGSCNVGDKKKQEDLSDLITALLKFNCSLSTTVVAQCRLHYKAVLDDSLIAVDTTSLHQHLII